MNRLLLDIYVPALERHFDIVIDSQTRIRDACTLLGKAIEEYSEGAYTSSGAEKLCSVSQNTVLRAERNMSDYQLKNGDSLLFC